MPTSVINEILSFCPQGTIASGDIMALEDYKNDVQRLRGHQPGIARRELENMALRQSSFVAAGLAQFVAKRYAPGVRDDADLVINGMKTSGKKRDNLGSIGKSFRRGCNSIAESATKKEGNQPSFFVGG